MRVNSEMFFFRMTAKTCVSASCVRCVALWIGLGSQDSQSEFSGVGKATVTSNQLNLFVVQYTKCFRDIAVKGGTKQIDTNLRFGGSIRLGRGLQVYVIVKVVVACDGQMVQSSRILLNR